MWEAGFFRGLSAVSESCELDAGFDVAVAGAFGVGLGVDDEGRPLGDRGVGEREVSPL